MTLARGARTSGKPRALSLALMSSAFLVWAMTQAASTLRPETAFETLDVPDVIRVRSQAFEPGTTIPDEFTAAGAGKSPPLAWSGVPPMARSLLLIVEDPDARGTMPYVHWLAYDLPPDTEKLGAGVAAGEGLDAVAGARQGKSSAGTVGYTPPHPPRQDGPHAYHFEVFALDARLNLPPAATREQVMAKARHHILAKGELVGTYESP